MPHAVFATKVAWQTFHDAYCADHRLPRPGRRGSDGTVQLGKQWTTAAFAPRVMTVNIAGTNRKIGVVRVPQAVVTAYGLNTITDPSPILDAQGRPTGQWNVTYNGTAYVVTLVDDKVAFPYAKPTAATWTDPADGKVYR